MIFSSPYCAVLVKSFVGSIEADESAPINHCVEVVWSAIFAYLLMDGAFCVWVRGLAELPHN